MKLTDKSAVIIILSAAISPVIVCILLALLGIGTNLAIVAAVYVVFGLPFVLIVGWLLSQFTKNNKKALQLSVVGYLAPVILINLAILGNAIGS